MWSVNNRKLKLKRMKCHDAKYQCMKYQCTKCTKKSIKKSKTTDLPKFNRTYYEIMIYQSIN